MISLNRETLKDKIYACWIGKNIGGTMGTPYEGRRELMDIQGFATPAGVVLPNDDLDLQLAWLLAMEEHGPWQLDAQILGEYWISYVVPHWNEYGIGKGNMKAGLLPPLAGEYRNNWKHSNGAWIRSEIWACLAPGCPDAAIRYAAEDACVDHGMAEGTYAEFFTAAVESAAFVETDFRRLVEIGLSKIPADCRVARSIRIALDSYDQGIDWKEARQRLVEDSTDLGWFQAPANLGFVILGMLYGEGDFKKSMICAINCGDDTDCTGATLGALFGILHGTAGIPEDWRAHIGDEIVTISLNNADRNFVKNCTELTRHVYEMIPAVLKANRAPVELTDGPDHWTAEDLEHFTDDTVARRLYQKPGYSYTIPFVHCTARVEFDGEPILSEGGTLPVRIRFFNRVHEVKHLHFHFYLPEGIRLANGCRDLYLPHQEGAEAVWKGVFAADCALNSVNRVLVEAVADGHPVAGYIPVIVLG
ncbi:MAG: ADP-ribosylglycohydrolase family protein [Candidatus Merdivicinus sp.]|jgi:ADP-ribosylglycohydrolase